MATISTLLDIGLFEFGMSLMVWLQYPSTLLDIGLMVWLQYHFIRLVWLQYPLY